MTHASSTTGVAAIKTVDAIRAHFPALTRRHNGLPAAFFDGPGGTQVPQMVATAVSDYLLYHNANTHWVYPSSVETDTMLDAARMAMADFLNARVTEVAFGNNMTTLTFHLARALGAAWGPGDEIVITELDHHANVAPWRRLAQERGITVKCVAMNVASGQLDWESLTQAIGPRTKLLAIGAGSNALGTITDVAAAGALAHAHGALVFVDAVHYAPHALVDVRALDCDFLACSPYKFYGPHAGVMYGKQSLIEALDTPRLDPAPNWAPERLETGTQNHEGIIGSGAAVDFLASLAEGTTRRQRLVNAFAGLHASGHALVEALWTGLCAIPTVTLYGPPPDQPRTPTISFTVRGHSSEQVARHLAERGVFVSNGDFYAVTVVSLLGHADDGVVRAGCSCYSTRDEIDRLVAGVLELSA